MTELLSKAIVNWLYAVEVKDAFLLEDAGKVLCSLLSSDGLSVLFNLITSSLSAEEKNWVKATLVG